MVPLKKPEEQFDLSEEAPKHEGDEEARILARQLERDGGGKSGRHAPVDSLKGYRWAKIR